MKEVVPWRQEIEVVEVAKMSLQKQSLEVKEEAVEVQSWNCSQEEEEVGGKP